MVRKAILVVDDDDAIQDVLSSALVRDYLVFMASTYSHALRFPISSIDLIILDYVLPDRDGFAVLQTVREVNPALPAIIMTGYGDEEVILRALRAHAADYLKKPVDLAYLRQRIAELLRNDRGKAHPTETLGKEDRLDTVVKHIAENYTEDLTLDQLSRLARMSKFNFCRAFKERFGQCCAYYINTVRIRNAVALLRDSHSSITEIAYSVGYRHSGHFNRVFRSIYNMSPREYRRKASNQSRDRTERFSSKLPRQRLSELFSEEQENAEWDENQPHIESDRCCPENFVSQRMINDKELENYRNKDRDKNQLV